MKHTVSLNIANKTRDTKTVGSREKMERGEGRASGLTKCSIARAERDGTRAETRFLLSPKRTSPFKLVRASVQSTAGSRGVRISLSNAG